MKKNHIIPFLSLPVIGLSLWFSLANRSKPPLNPNNSRPERPSDAEANTNIENQLKTVFFEAYKNYVIKDEGRILSKTIQVQDTGFTKKKIANLVSDKGGLLIFRYSYRDCDMCTNSVISSLKKIFTAEELRQYVHILTNANNERDFKIKTQYENSGISTYYIVEESGLGLQMENKSLPFLFVLTPELQVIKTFIPFKETPGDTEYYLEVIKSYLTGK